MIGRPARRSRRALALAVLLAIVAFVGLPSRTLAAEAVSFGAGSASSKFGAFIEVKQPVTLAARAERVEVLVTTPGALGPAVAPLAQDAGAGTSTLEYRIDLTDGHIVPNTTFTIRFRVVDGSGSPFTGPAITHTYADDRYTWKELGGNVVRVHWVEGDQRFGERALKIGDDAVAETAKLLGVTESDPIDFFIYADEPSFRAALGPATRENVGGQAHPDIRTLFALITPGEINAGWVESVVPHELTHVVFATAVDNAYHEPPHWLNEGLAVYLADSYDGPSRAAVKSAVATGSIIPLDGLSGAFPTTRDRFFLAYAESVSAVDRIVRVNGRDALVKLIRSYRDGVSDDDAFRAALGRDVAGFEADWLAELGARVPTRLGPRPAPVGPLPAGWGAAQPDPSFEITGSLPPVRPGAPAPAPGGSRPIAGLLDSVAVLGLVVAVVALVLTVRVVRRRALPSGIDEPGDNRLFGRGPTDGPLHGYDDPTEPPLEEPRDAGAGLWSETGWSLPQVDGEDSAEVWARRDVPERDPQRATADGKAPSRQPTDPDRDAGAP